MGQKECNKRWYAKHGKEYHRKWREKNRERVNELAREQYHRNSERIKCRMRLWKEENKEHIRQYKWHYRRSKQGKIVEILGYYRNRIKYLCRAQVNHAIRDGVITRGTCYCGKIGEAHHDDYTKPFQITWLCKTHHAEHHRLTTC